MLCLHDTTITDGMHAVARKDGHGHFENDNRLHDLQNCAYCILHAANHSITDKTHGIDRC